MAEQLTDGMKDLLNDIDSVHPKRREAFLSRLREGELEEALMFLYGYSIEVPTWWSNGGGMAFRRDALPDDHPGSIPNYILNELGLIPSDFGYGTVCCPHCGQSLDQKTLNLIKKQTFVEDFEGLSKNP